MKRKHQPGEREPTRPGWAAPKREEGKDERPISTLNSAGAIASHAARASANSGPKIAPGTGSSK
jgi:hypothetical protein